MSVLDKFLDAIRLNDDYEEEDADSDSFFDEEDDDIEEKPKKRFFRKLENEDEDEEEEPQAKTVHTAPRKQPRQRPPLQARLLLHELQSQLLRFPRKLLQ